jgi:hypothetical protein
MEKYEAETIEAFKRIAKSNKDKFIVVKPYLSAKKDVLKLCIKIEGDSIAYEKMLDRRCLPSLQDLDKKVYLEAATKAIVKDLVKAGFYVSVEPIKEYNRHPRLMRDDDLGYLFKILSEVDSQ